MINESVSLTKLKQIDSQSQVFIMKFIIILAENNVTLNSRGLENMLIVFQNIKPYTEMPYKWDIISDLFLNLDATLHKLTELLDITRERLLITILEDMDHGVQSACRDYYINAFLSGSTIYLNTDFYSIPPMEQTWDTLNVSLTTYELRRNALREYFTTIFKTITSDITSDATNE